MGLSCFHLFPMLAGGVAALVAAVGLFLLFSPSHRGLGARLVAGGALAGGASAAALFWALRASGPSYSTSLSAFREEFGVAAPSDVTGLQSEASGWSDSARRFLRFRASQRTIDALVSPRFKPAPAADCARLLVFKERPDWWRPEAAVGSCYLARPFDAAFANNKAWLTYDPASGVAHYYYSGVD